MFKCKVLPDTDSDNILIHGLCVAGSVEEASELANDMEKYRLQTDFVIYNIIVKKFHFCLLGLMSGEAKIVQQMPQKKLNPDVVTCHILVCGHFQVGNV